MVNCGKERQLLVQYITRTYTYRLEPTMQPMLHPYLESELFMADK